MLHHIWSEISSLWKEDGWDSNLWSLCHIGVDTMLHDHLISNKSLSYVIFSYRQWCADGQWIVMMVVRSVFNMVINNLYSPSTSPLNTNLNRNYHFLPGLKSVHSLIQPPSSSWTTINTTWGESLELLLNLWWNLSSQCFHNKAHSQLNQKLYVYWQRSIKLCVMINYNMTKHCVKEKGIITYVLPL